MILFSYLGSNSHSTAGAIERVKLLILLKRKPKNASTYKFLSALSRVPDNEPVEGDRLN